MEKYFTEQTDTNLPEQLMTIEAVLGLGQMTVGSFACDLNGI